MSEPEVCARCGEQIPVAMGREVLSRQPVIVQHATEAACSEAMKGSITKLRAFALAMYEADETYDILGDMSLEVVNTLRDCGLTDEHGRPTPLLMGQKGGDA